MRAPASSPELLVLHALRLRGPADHTTIVDRFALDSRDVGELLLDFEAYGWIQRAGGLSMPEWALTETGRVRGEQLLAEELDVTGTRRAVTKGHKAFTALDSRFVQVVARWTVHPTRDDPRARNDHSDRRWDFEVLGDLSALWRRSRRICEGLSGSLARFDGYFPRFTNAVSRTWGGGHAWMAGPDVDSCQAVWSELREDLNATLARNA